MANLTGIITLIGEMFDIFDALIEGFVDLATGNLLVLTFVTLIIGSIVAIVALVINTIKKQMNASVNMKK
jgi:hypothetical protein